MAVTMHYSTECGNVGGGQLRGQWMKTEETHFLQQKCSTKYL